MRAQFVLNSLFPASMRAILVLILVATTAVSALPQDVVEEQRMCWQNEGRCVTRPAYVTVPTSGLTFLPSDGSPALPIPYGHLNAAGSNLYTDEYRAYGILGRDDVDAYELQYNQSANPLADASHVFLSNLFVMASERTTRVEVVWAVFGDAAAFTTSYDATARVISEADVRARAAAAGTPVPADLRLLGSQVLATRDRAANYTVNEQKVCYYAPAGFLSGCVRGTAPPFPPGLPPLLPPYTFDPPVCDFTNAIIVNPGKLGMPKTGRLLIVLYEKRGKPVPYIAGVGSHSLTNYLPGAFWAGTPIAAFGYTGPTGQFATGVGADSDSFAIGRNYGNLLALGSRLYDAIDLDNDFAAVACPFEGGNRR